MSESVDSHKKSLSKVVNSFGGYPIRCGLGVVILPPSIGWIKGDPLAANLGIIFVYASVSFARSYFPRRIFEKFGIDDNFIRLGLKSAKKIQSYFENRTYFLSIHIRGMKI